MSEKQIAGTLKSGFSRASVANFPGAEQLALQEPAGWLLDYRHLQRIKEKEQSSWFREEAHI